MPWFSILPQSINFIEIWAIRLFVVLGVLMIGPWILLLIYDVILFLFRTILYDFPVIGGRARNRPRPRAPSLRKRPGGRDRSLSFPLPGITSAPNSPIFNIASGFEEKIGNGNGSVVQRRKMDLPNDIPEESRKQLQAFCERHSREDIEHIDKTAIASETGLTTNQVREWFANHQQLEDVAKTAPLSTSPE